MSCCPECFGDGYLKNDVIPQLSTQVGTCSYCGSLDQPLVTPTDLREHFELLIGIYVRQDDAGRTLVEWLRDDWSMFSHDHMDVAHAKELLADILDDGEIVRQFFAPSDKSKSDALQRWEALKNELMHLNRYFPKTEINLERLKQWIGLLLLRQSEIPKKWFRARIQQSALPFSPEEMKAPPKHLASHGRANPAGIPYLYLASTALTAVSEIRPHTGEIVSVAEFSIPANLKIADLRHPKKTISPFYLGDENEISSLRGDIEFLEKLGDELTRPVLPRSAAFDYIPSQYLCESIKVGGYDGVMYRSSVGDGVNIALFQPDCAQVLNVTPHQVSRVSVDIEQKDT